MSTDTQPSESAAIASDAWRRASSALWKAVEYVAVACNSGAVGGLDFNDSVHRVAATAPTDGIGGR